MRPSRSTIRAPQLTAILPFIAVIAIEKSADAQSILLASTSALAEYSLSGQLIANPLLTGPLLMGGPFGIAELGGDVFISNGSTVSEYTTAGVLVNPALITGLSQAFFLTTHEGNLYLADQGTGIIGEYTTAGVPINADLMTVPVPTGITFAGNDIYVSLWGTGAIGEYTDTGAPVNPSLITLHAYPLGITAFEGNLYVASFGSTAVAEYNLSGQPVNTSFITDAEIPLFIDPDTIAFANGNLYLYTSKGVSEYTASGTLINAALIPGPAANIQFAIVPEPSSVVLLALGGVAVTFAARRHGRRPR